MRAPARPRRQGPILYCIVMYVVPDLMRRPARRGARYAAGLVSLTDCPRFGLHLNSDGASSGSALQLTTSPKQQLVRAVASHRGPRQLGQGTPATSAYLVTDAR